jgi:hypothetical protein
VGNKNGLKARVDKEALLNQQRAIDLTLGGKRLRLRGPESEERGKMENSPEGRDASPLSLLHSPIDCDN